MSDVYLVHHGILGQKWGVRRFQNEDGSYTSRGRERHSENEMENEYDDNRQKVKVRDVAKSIKNVHDRRAKRNKKVAVAALVTIGALTLISPEARGKIAKGAKAVHNTVPKLSSNSKFDPIDTTWKFVN